MPELVKQIRYFNAIYWQIGRFINSWKSQQCGAFLFNQKKTCDLTAKFPGIDIYKVNIFGNAQHEHTKKGGDYTGIACNTFLELDF